MISKLKAFFEEHLAIESDATPRAREHAHHLACAALLVEMTRADHEVDDSEMQAVAEAIRRAFGLDARETGELLALAEDHADAATSLYEFTALINAHLDEAAKLHFIELMWTVALADGRIDSHEEHLVRRVADLIHVRHSEFIQAKLRVQAAS